MEKSRSVASWDETVSDKLATSGLFFCGRPGNMAPKEDLSKVVQPTKIQDPSDCLDYCDYTICGSCQMFGI